MVAYCFRMKFLPVLGLSALLLPACAVPGDAVWSGIQANASAGAYATSFGFEGDGVTVEDSSGSGFDFSGDIDLDDQTSTVLYAGARVGLAPFDLSISQFSYSESSDGTVSSASQFGGEPVSGDLAVGSDLDMSVAKMMLGIDVFNSGLFRVGIQGGVDYLDLNQFDLIAQENKGSVQSGDVQTILEDQSIAVPILGVRGDVALPFRIRLGGEISGTSVEFDEADVSMLDWDLNAHWQIFWHVELMVGWRSVIMDLDGSVDGTSMDVDMDFQGPYIGITVFI